MAVAGQPTFQGSRDPGTDSQFITGEHEAYFPVLGNGDLLYADATVYGYPAAQLHGMTKHIVNFAGELEFFSVKTNGNSMPCNTIFSVRINDVDTAQVVVAESEISGKYECSEPAVAFISDDAVVGYCTSPTTAPGGGSPCLLLAYVQMTPEADESTCYRTTAGDLPIAYSHGGTAQIPFSGSVGHYNSERSEQYPSESADFVAPTQMRIRSTGNLTYLQAHMELADVTDLVLVYIQKNDEPADENSPVLVCPGNLDYWGYYTDTTHSLAVEPGDLVNFRALAGALGTYATIWNVGCNFNGTTGNNGVDVMVYEAWELSGSYSDPTTRADDWDYWDPTRTLYPTSDNRGDRTIRLAAPIGTFKPELEPMDIPDYPTSFTDGYRILMARPYEIEPTFEMDVRSLRVYMDVNTSGVMIRVSLEEERTFRNGLFVECYDPGWYENSIDTRTVGPDDPTLDPAYAQRLGIIFCPQDYVQDETYPIVTTEAIAHIASVGFTYGAHTDNRECLVRVLPDATPVEPLPSMTRLARSIKITRPDGVVRAYTEHDEDLVHEGVTYKARGGGMKATANELGAALGDVGNIETAGYSALDGIEVDDLFGGSYDSATAEVWLLPWGPDNDQEARRIGGGVLGRNRQQDDTFSIETLSWSAYLSQRSLLEIVTPTCRYELGESRCGVILPCLTVTGQVTIATTDTSAIGQRRKFQDVLRTEDAGYFSEGLLTFTSGPNTGHTRKIKKHEALGLFTFWDPFVYPIGVGDDYSLSPGCDKKAQTCKTKFDNYVNFGGFEFVPGADAASQTPSGKLGQ